MGNLAACHMCGFASRRAGVVCPGMGFATCPRVVCQACPVVIIRVWVGVGLARRVCSGVGGGLRSCPGYAKKGGGTLVVSGLVAFAFGFYDGFFGPGTGSFLLFAFLMVGFDFIGAAANARALNFASNISASLLFAYFGLVEFSYVIPMGLAMIAGAWCGAHMALKKGTGYVRPLFVIMTTVLIGKQLIDLWK